MTASQPGTAWSGERGRLMRLIVLLVSLPAFATAAFLAIEGWGVFDSLDLAVSTLRRGTDGGAAS